MKISNRAGNRTFSLAVKNVWAYDPYKNALKSESDGARLK